MFPDNSVVFFNILLICVHLCPKNGNYYIDYHQRTRQSNGCCSEQNSAKENDADNMIALDGERKINVYKREKFTIGLNLQGPWVIDVDYVLSFASIYKHFITVG